MIELFLFGILVEYNEVFYQQYYLVQYNEAFNQ